MTGPPGTEGRWSLTLGPGAMASKATEMRVAIAKQILDRHGVLTRESLAVESVVGGFSAVYPVLRSMEEAGTIRRGYFVAAQGGLQFASAGADERLRAKPESGNSIERYTLAATDPANVYGATLPWPARAKDSGRPSRSAGARVVIADGALLGYLNRTADGLLTWVADDDEGLTQLVQALVAIAGAQSLILKRIDNHPAGEAAPHIVAALRAAGFAPSGEGLMYRAAGNLATPRRRR